MPDRRRRGPAGARSLGSAKSATFSTRLGSRSSGWRALFAGRVHVELQRHGLRDEEQRNRALLELARRLRLPLVATNGVRYARREDKPLHDVLTCDPPPHHARRRRRAARRTPRAPPEGRRARWRGSSPTCPQAVGGDAPSSPARSTSRSPTSATASPTTRCRRARPRSPTCASSPGTAPAPASARSPRKPRRRSRRSSR